MITWVPWEIAKSGDVVFDTCVLVDSFKADTRRGVSENLVSQVRRRGRSTTITCLFEFLRRADGDPLARFEFESRQAWLHEKRISTLPFDDAAGEALERLALLRERGPALADAHVAAICVGLRRPLLTRNVSDFDGVEGLRLVSAP